MGALEQDEIRELFRTASRLGMQRSALLSGIEPRFLATIPIAETPATQLLLDLQALNESLDGGDIPLTGWLHNAILLSEARRQDLVFRRLLAKCSSRERHPRRVLPELLEGCWSVGLQSGDRTAAPVVVALSRDGRFSVTPAGVFLGNGMWTVDGLNRLCLLEGEESPASLRVELTVKIVDEGTLECWSPPAQLTTWYRMVPTPPDSLGTKIRTRRAK